MVGMPDERWGEVPRAFVTLVEGAAEISEADLVGWVRARLAPFKAPKSVIVLEHLPTVGTGKVDKQALRAWP